MADTEPNTTPSADTDAAAAASDAAAAASDAAVAQAQSTADKINDQGYLGIKVDPAPNEDYTVAGVTKDAKNP